MAIHIDTPHGGAQQLRGYNEKLTETGKTVAGKVIDSYEKVALGIADRQEQAASAGNIRWLTVVATAQAGMTRDLAKAYSGAARRLLD